MVYGIYYTTYYEHITYVHCTPTVAVFTTPLQLPSINGRVLRVVRVFIHRYNIHCINTQRPYTHKQTT